jgi:predicted DNA-binding protein
VQYFVLHLGDNFMTRSVTTSVRLTADLRLQLDHAAHRLHRGKNWIVSQALVEYLAKLDESKLVNEAQRQSLLAKEADQANEDIEIWDQNQDDAGWH